MSDSSLLPLRKTIVQSVFYAADARSNNSQGIQVQPVHWLTFSNRTKYDSLSKSFFSSICLNPASTISWVKTS